MVETVYGYVKQVTIFRKVYTTEQEYIICGDIEIYYLTDSERKSQFDSFLRANNLRIFQIRVQIFNYSYWK
jgi:hypothetical protein